MARGKYATRAEKTAAISQTVSEVDRLRAANVKLLAENKSLRQKLDDQVEVHADRVRAVRAQVDEGVSDELVAARAEVATLRDDKAKLRARNERLLRAQRNFLQKASAALISAGVSYSVAADLVSYLQNPVGTLVTSTETAKLPRGSEFNFRPRS